MNLPPKDETSSTTARRIGDGFLILRRITSITSATESELQSGCVKLHTEDIHPFELFHSFNFESLTQLPYNHVYGGEENEEEEDNRELNSNYAFPDNPMKYCSDPSFGPFDPPNWWTFPKYAVKYGNPYTTNQDFLALMSVKNGGCIQYSKDFSGGFYYNCKWIL